MCTIKGYNILLIWLFNPVSFSVPSSIKRTRCFLVDNYGDSGWISDTSRETRSLGWDINNTPDGMENSLWVPIFYKVSRWTIYIAVAVTLFLFYEFCEPNADGDLLKMYCWQCNALVLTLDQEACTTTALLVSFWPAQLLAFRSSTSGYFFYCMDSAQHKLTRWTKKNPWSPSSALYIFVRIPPVYMALTASDRRLDRFGASERCVICKSFLCSMMHYTETCVLLVGLPLSVRRTILDVIFRLTIGEVKIFGRTDKVSLM